MGPNPPLDLSVTGKFRNYNIIYNRIVRPPLEFFARLRDIVWMRYKTNALDDIT